ncbi:MAG: PEP-CTERM sorting domain-containing protein [Aquabacterium sp.]
MRLILTALPAARHAISWPMLASAFMLASAASVAHADLAYTFDAGLENFRLNDPAAGALSWQAQGHLRVQDLTDATNVQLLLPETDLRNWAAFQGGTLSFDARLESPISSYWPEFGAVTLLSLGGNASVDLVPANEPGTAWKTYTLKLDGATFGKSEAAFAETLAGLQEVQINLEAGNGAIETVLIDNVRVTAVPEPATWALGLVGLAGVVGATRRPFKR